MGVGMESENVRFRLELPQGTSNDVVALKDAKIRARGVCVKQVHNFGEIVQPLLLVQDLTNITVMQLGRPDLLVPSTAFPCNPSLPSWRDSRAKKSDAQVHVQGTVLSLRGVNTLSFGMIPEPS